jgi:hypothetical protein
VPSKQAESQRRRRITARRDGRCVVEGAHRRNRLARHGDPAHPATLAEFEGRSIALTIDAVSGRRVPDPHAPEAVSPPARSAGVAADRHRVAGLDEEGIDRWGRSERTRAMVRALVEPAYRFWFRFQFENVERIPAEGGALLVANHAGLVPVDAALVMHGIERELDRPVYGMHHHALAAVPGLGVLLARAGGVVADPDNALRLLRDDGQLLVVFPEGTKGTNKLYRAATGWPASAAVGLSTRQCGPGCRSCRSPSLARRRRCPSWGACRAAGR